MSTRDRAELLAYFSQAPIAICILVGPELRYEFANASYLRLVGKKPDILGRPLLKAFSDLRGQGLDALMRGVLTTGVPYENKQLLVRFDADGKGIANHYIDLVYQPMRNAEGHVKGVMVVATDVTETVRMRELAAEKTDLSETRFQLLRQAVRSRDDLLATVSHDLRNPLSSIRLSAHLLGDAPTSPAAQRQAAIIDRAAVRMERLIGDLLDIASIEAGHLSIEVKAFRALELVSEAVEAIEPLAAAKAQHVHLDVTASAAIVACDRSRILQVLGNILGNAVKFTPADGAITARAELVDRTVSFSVSDSGPGIAPEQLPHVFDRFWQAKETARAGTGLGLAICKGIIDSHGGRIWVESAIGAGTTFYFTLPLAE